MTSDIKALVAELEKLDSVATPAPWGASPSLCCRDRGTVSVQETGHTQPSHAFATWDADLVAATRNALPALLAELKRLWAVEQESDELRTVAEAAKALCLARQAQAAAEWAKDEGLIVLARDEFLGAYASLCAALDHAGVKP